VNDQHGTYQTLVNAAEQFLAMAEDEGTSTLSQESIAYLCSIFKDALSDVDFTGALSEAKE
jgi:hypothetical protein